jgi:uncharacterized protein
VSTAGPGRLAVVTGASTGIGFELTRCLSRDGWTVVAAADEERIHDAARELSAEGAGHVQAVQVDLATREGVDALAREAGSRPETLGAVVLNAGAAAHGRTDEVPLGDDLRVVDLNARGVVHLLKLLLPELLEHGWGRVLVTSSVASAAPGPHQATYDASKAFVHTYALAVREELRGTGVTVTSARPGPVDTRFFARAGMLRTRLASSTPKDDPATVARDAYEAMLDGRATIVPGSSLVRVQDTATRLLPDALRARLLARFTR